MDELSRDEVDALLRDQVVGRIGCSAGGETYVVPVIYAWDGEAVWVATVEGRKIRTMRENPRVCFEVDEYSGPGVWRSAILQGDYEELSGEDAEHALELLRARFSGGAARRPRETGREPVVFRIRVREASGRAVGR